MIESDRLLLAVEITYLAAAHIDEAESKSRRPLIDQIEIDELRQKSLQRIDGIKRGALDADLGLDAHASAGLGR